jgi:hypothetical protein
MAAFFLSCPVTDIRAVWQQIFVKFVKTYGTMEKNI